MKAAILDRDGNGIDASKRDASKADNRKFMQAYVNDFKSFVMDAIEDGIAYEYDDHNVFLKACLEAFIDINEEE